MLYELFTGKRVFEARSLPELISLHEKSTPPTPSSHVKEIDPLAERVILRCLEKDPKARPASAVQVALALPGGDPLQAALAMGETPSPEMVAASGEKTGLRPAVAVACLAAVVIGLFLSFWVSGKVNLIERQPLEHSPEILAGKAREISARLGYTDHPFDRHWELAYDGAYLNDVLKNDHSPRRWDHLRFPAVVFSYRESPERLQTVYNLGDYQIAATPAPGTIFITLDPQGRLREFSAEPYRANQAAAPAFDWTALFHASGLDPARFTPAEPQWTPPFAFDAHVAWTGAGTDQPSVPLRIEAAAWRGKPVHFRIFYPWTRDTRFEYFRHPAVDPTFNAVLILISLIGAALVAKANYRRGRGDRQGAFKLFSLVFSLFLLAAMFGAHYAPPARYLLAGLFNQMSMALYWSANVWLWYFAFEPFVRRYWPASIVSWSRILSGRLRDALVGRHLLIGILVGVILFFFRSMANYRSGYQFELGLSAPEPSLLTALHGIRIAGSHFFAWLAVGILIAVWFLFFLFLLRVLLRRQWLAGGIAILFLTTGAPQLSFQPIVSAPAQALIVAALVILSTRFGLVALISAITTLYMLQGFPLTLNFSAWYFGIGLIGPLAVLALAIYGFYTSLGGQKVFQGSLLED